MTKMTPLLERNEQFAAAYTPGPLGPPAAQLVIVTCLDHRVDPAIVLGLQLGDAVVIRNAGGRVTPAVIDDIAYLAFLAGQLFGGQVAAARALRSRGRPPHAVRHRLPRRPRLPAPGRRGDRPARGGAGSRRRRRPAHARSAPTSSACSPHPRCSPKVSVSGHVYDIATGRVTTVR